MKSHPLEERQATGEVDASNEDEQSSVESERLRRRIGEMLMNQARILAPFEGRNAEAGRASPE